MVTSEGRCWSVPAETAAHERCLVAWPTRRRHRFWRGRLDEARAAYAQVILAIAGFEPVLVIADVAEGDTANRLVGHRAEIVELPIDDSWIRDSGPLVVIDDHGRRLALDFRFNGWGHKFDDFVRDDAVAGLVASHLGLTCSTLPMVLEGGSIALDGTGTVVTTRRCLQNPNRNPEMTVDEIEGVLRDELGVARVVWLPDGLVDDDGTDGHVDNVVAFFDADRCLLQSTRDRNDPDRQVAAENRRILRAAGIDVVDVDVLPAVECFGERVEVPYLNFYVANGGVVVPTTGHPADADMVERIGSCFPGREVVGVPGEVLAFGGGGVHCITMQIPASP